jgi:hypothetical protein
MQRKLMQAIAEREDHYLLSGSLCKWMGPI